MTGAEVHRLADPLLLALLLSSCTGDANAPGDSTPEPLQTLVLAAQPEVTIGTVKGEAPYLLDNVSDATRLSDGTIVAVNCGSAEIRYFDAAGRHVRTVGGEGQGPGEFTLSTRIFPAGGDSVGVYDPFQVRVTVLAPDGEVGRTLSVGTFTARGRPDVVGRLADGSFVARRSDPAPTVEPGTPYRTTYTLLRLDPSGRAADSVAGLPGTDFMAPENERGPTLALRLGRMGVFAVRPDGVLYGGQDEFGIIELDGSLEPVDTIATITRPAPITPEVRDAYQAMRDARDHMPPDGIGRAVVEEYAPLMPAFGTIVAGRDGRLWVEDPFRPGHHPLVWTAYEGGTAVARLEIPPRFFPFELGPDWVLGVSYDELTVERIELRRMVPGELTGAVLTPREAEPPAVPRCGAWASR